MSYMVRPATPGDIPGVAAVAHDTWKVTYALSVSEQNQRQHLRRAYANQALRTAISQMRGWFYVAVENEAVVGFAQYVRRFDTQGELVRMYVHPNFQRRGIGRDLLETGLTAMNAAGIDQCYVSVEVSNLVARTFYERFGFRPQRDHARFLGDQIIRLVEYTARITDLLRSSSREQS